MTRVTALLCASLIWLLAGTAMPVAASAGSIGDPNDDGQQAALDIQSIRVVNGQHAIQVEVRVNRFPVGYGQVTVYVQDRSRSVVGGFGAMGPRAGEDELFDREGPRKCKGFRVTWNPESHVARMQLPSRCYKSGNYEAIQVRVVTEDRTFDCDYAPKSASDAWRWSRFIDRTR